MNLKGLGSHLKQAMAARTSAKNETSASSSKKPGTSESSPIKSLKV